MHELSIASGIVELVEDEVSKANAAKVESVELDIGELSGVEISALEFAWEAVTRDTKLDGARLVIHRIKATAECNECGKSYELDSYFSPCPVCGSFRQEVKQGKELRVRSIMVD